MTTTAGAGFRFVCPPNWPQPREGWTPPEGWEPDATWGPAPYGWAFWQPAAPPYVRPPIDGYAVTALVFGSIGGFIFSLIFGIVALSRIRRGLRRGRRLVFIGWTVCALWIVGGLVFLGFQVVSQPGRAPSGTVTASGKVAPMALRVGDCLQAPAASINVGDITGSVDVVPCGEPHNAQVFATVSLDADSYPGEDQTTQLALNKCEPKAYDYLGDNEVSNLRVVTFVAQEDGWKKGEHTARCLLVDEVGLFTGEARDHG